MPTPTVTSDQVLDLIARHADLPVAYRTWVTERSKANGLPELRTDVQLGVGELASWDGLISRCERELKYRATAR